MTSIDTRETVLTERLLTAQQAARLLAVRVSWVYGAAREGTLPHIHLGRHIRFTRADLEAFVDRQRGDHASGD
jgi:excisionase family DNA binding protein